MTAPSPQVGYANFIRLAVVNGVEVVIYRFQNYYLNEQIEFEGQLYDWLPFQVSESENSSEGDNTSATILLPNVVLTLQVVNGNDGLGGQQITIVSTYINPTTGAILSGGRTRNLYTVDSVSVNEDTIQIECASVVNALLSSFPRTKLTEANSGKLPQTSQIRFV